jgi:DNA-binding MarR family transcriptional regulator
MSKKRPSRPDVDAFGLGHAIWHVANQWERAINEALSDLAINHMQYVMLAAIAQLSEQGDPITQTRVSKASRADVMMTSKTLRLLEERGLVSRNEHPKDTRARSVELTKEGQNIMRKGAKAVQKADESFFGTGGQSDKLRKTILAIADSL